jgi:hypothetical protein
MSKKEKKRADKKTEKEQLVNSAVIEGIKAIIHDHPRFSQQQNYIASHIDKKKLSEKIRELYVSADERGLSNEKSRKYVFESLANYIAGGAAFDEQGREMVLKTSLEAKAQKGYFRGIAARRTLEGEKYLDKVLGAFGELYQLFENNAYAERMPELKKAAETVTDMGFLNSAVEVLKGYGMMDKRRYAALKRSIQETTQKNASYFTQSIEAYLTPQRTAAVVLGVLGIGLLSVFGFRATGAVISTMQTSTPGIIGIFMILIALFLMLKKKQI